MIVDAEQHANAETGMQVLAKILRRRVWTMIVVLLLAVATPMTVISLMPERWSAESVVTLDPRQVQVSPDNAVVSRLPQEASVLRSELDVIHSRSLAERVVDMLGPDASALLASAPWNETTTGRALKLGRAFLGIEEAEETVAGIDVRDVAAETLRQRIHAANDGRSFTIFIGFSAPDPEAAAMIANTYARAYVQHLADGQGGATEHAQALLQARVADLAQGLAAAESAVLQHRQKSGMIEDDGRSLIEHRIAALNLKLADARAARAAAVARLEAARIAVANGGDGLAEVNASGNIAFVRSEQDKIRREIAEIEQTGATRSERLPVLRSALASLEEGLGAEIRRLAAEIDADAQIAVARENEIASALAGLEADALSAGRDRTEVQRLEREAAATRSIYESVLNRYKQAIEQSSLLVPEATLITPARPPTAPSGPRLAPALALSVFGGLAAGGLLAVARDRIDGRVRCDVALESVARAPLIGRLPRLRLHSLKDAVVRAPRSQAARALHALCAGVRLSARTAGARVLLVTSVHRRDGRSTVTMALARTFALSGSRVVLVDADLCLSGFAHLEKDGMSSDHLSDVRIFSLGDADQSAEARLGSPSFELTMDRLRSDYDVVIVDAPPLDEGGAALLAGSVADVVLLVVRWGATTYEEVAASARDLKLCGIKLGGIVVNRASGPRYLGRFPLPVPQKRVAEETGSRSPPMPATQPSGDVLRIFTDKNVHQRTET